MLNIEQIKNELLSGNFISGVHYFEEADSTNSFAKSQAGDDILVIAEYQIAGKGRYERMWESEKGLNLTFTLKKKLDIPVEKIPFVNFFFSYYIYEVIKELLEQKNINSSPLVIKWPNDILYDNKKLCGVLVESNLTRKEFIVGIGINVNQKIFTRIYNALSIGSIVNAEIDRSGLLLSLINRFSSSISYLHNTDEKLFRQWKAATNIIGKSVIFNSNEEQNRFAKVVDLLMDGGIKLLINGQESTFYSGEIRITLIGN